MANEQNLIPHRFTHDQDREAAARNGRKGGVACGAARRAKREARETAKLVLDFKPDLPPQMLETMRRMGLKKSIRPDMRYIATLAIMQKAMKGDMQCYKFLLELAEEYLQQQNITLASDSNLDALNEAFAALKGDAKGDDEE